MFIEASRITPIDFIVLDASYSDGNHIRADTTITQQGEQVEKAHNGHIGLSEQRQRIF